MKKKALLKVAFITTTLFLGMVVAQLVHLGKSNPIMHLDYNLGDVAPDQSTKPPMILVFSPQNDTLYGVDAVSLSLNVSIGECPTASFCALEEVYCETDWQSNNISVYKYSWKPAPLVVYTSSNRTTEFSGTINVTGIPEGNHTMMIYAVEIGQYTISIRQDSSDNRNFYHTYNSFNMTGCSSVNFTVDTTLPKVSLLSPQNETYYSSKAELELYFNVSEETPRIVYSLDGYRNETTAGNMTLTRLSYGGHNVTVFAIDRAGHVGASETIYFSVEEPYPATVFIASITSLAVIIIGLLVYVKTIPGNKSP